MKYYLAYGSNLNIEQMKHRCPDAKRVGSAELHGYRLAFRGHRMGVLTIEPDSESSIPVGIWTISDDDEISLDFYEGFPRLYRKEIFTVQLNGETIEAIIYIMNEGRPISAPSDYYLEAVSTGYKDFRFELFPLMGALADTKAI